MAAPDSFASSLYAEPLAASRKERRANSREFLRRVTMLAEISADFLTCVFSLCAACFVYHSLQIGSPTQYPLQEIAALSIVFGLFGVLLLQRDGAYRGDGSLLQIRETERAIRIPAQALLLLLPFCLLLRLNIPRAAFLITLILAPLLLSVQKQMFLLLIRILHAGEHGIDRAVIYGAGDAGTRIVSLLLCSPRLGLRPVALIDDDPATARRPVLDMGYRRCRSIPVQSGPVTPALLKSLHCRLLIVAIPNLSPEKIAAVTDAAEQAGVPTACLTGPAVEEWPRIHPTNMDSLLLTSLIEPVTPWHDTIAKRAADLLVSSLLLLLLAPFFVLIAVLIRLDSPGPALFVQRRVGRNGKLFDIYKFRSMHTNVPRYDFSPTRSCDPRITRIGRFLRRNSLDELPQLLNVLLGEMSLVGPRPEMPFIVESYNSRQRQRLQVTPGITGLWQLSAARASSIHENIQYDLYYIRNHTFFMDIAILIHTLLFAICGGV